MNLLAWCLVASLCFGTLQEGAHVSIEQLPEIKELPDPFLKRDGSRISKRDEWKEQRKALLESVLRYEYGALPPVPRNVQAKEVAVKELEEGVGLERELLLSMGPKRSITTRLFLSVPSGARKFPVIVVGDLGWGRVKPEIVLAVLRRGYAIAEFSRNEIASDDAQPTGVFSAYPNYHGGRISAWAWGYHRVIDYLVTQSFVNSKCLVVTGHSRGGKAALLAGATDERIALTAPNNSGCGGAGCFRVVNTDPTPTRGEDITAILKNFPFWFEPQFGEFIGKVAQLPFDQHTVKALIAPRALLSTEALGDHWANPHGTQLTYLAAKEVYAFFGVKNRIGIHFREGEHEHNLYDWETLLEFADMQFFNRRSSRSFLSLPFERQTQAFSWSAPQKP